MQPKETINPLFTLLSRLFRSDLKMPEKETFVLSEKAKTRRRIKKASKSKVKKRR